MIDVLAQLDRVINDLQPATSLDKWRKSSLLPVVPGAENVAGIPNPLTRQGLPILPVVPVPNGRIGEPKTKAEKNLDLGNRKKNDPPHEILSKRSGSAGSTGSIEAFRGQNTSRQSHSHGKSEAATGSRCGFASDGNPIDTRETKVSTVKPESLLLPDGRRMHSLDAGTIPATVVGHNRELRKSAHWRAVVLNPGGCKLILVERWLISMSPETLRAIEEHAGSVNMVPRARCAGVPGGK